MARAIPSKLGIELLDALKDMGLREGFANLGVFEIATRLSCSKRTLHCLAPSKRELVLLVLKRFFARIRCDAATACENAGDAQQRIYAYLQAGVRAAGNLSPTSLAARYSVEVNRSAVRRRAFDCRRDLSGLA